MDSDFLDLLPSTASPSYSKRKRDLGQKVFRMKRNWAQSDNKKLHKDFQ